MKDRRPVHPAVTALLVIFVIVFFGGGLLVFVNNLIVHFLPKAVESIIGGTVLALFLVMLVVSKCVSGVRCVRKLAGTGSATDVKPTKDTQ